MKIWSNYSDLTRPHLCLKNGYEVGPYQLYIGYNSSKWPCKCVTGDITILIGVPFISGRVHPVGYLKSPLIILRGLKGSPFSQFPAKKCK